MRRTLLDVPSIVALYNVRKRRYIFKLHSYGVMLISVFVQIYKIINFYLNQFNQINFQQLSKSLIKKSAILMNCFSRPFCYKSLISFYFEANYKPINKNGHETDAFDHSWHFCAL